MAEEYIAGQEEGTKDRLCAIVAAIQSDDDGRMPMLVFPVTHTVPDNLDLTVEIPATVKKHLGLDGEHSRINS